MYLQGDYVNTLIDSAVQKRCVSPNPAMSDIWGDHSTESQSRNRVNSAWHGYPPLLLYWQNKQKIMPFLLVHLGCSAFLILHDQFSLTEAVWVCGCVCVFVCVCLWVCVCVNPLWWPDNTTCCSKDGAAHQVSSGFCVKRQCSVIFSLP